MNNDEKVLLIVCIFICVLVGGMIFAGFKAGHLKAVPEPQKFSVVDTYGQCDVVQYNHPGDAKLHYFLDCSSK
jgi:hypothetical protein